MQFPSVAVPDGPHLLDVLNRYVGAGFVLAEYEVRPARFQVEAFGEAKLAVFVVVFDGPFLPRHGGAWVVVATFPEPGGLLPSSDRLVPVR